MDPRYIELQKWLGKNIKGPFEMKPLAGDASFRRYFRVHGETQTWVAMDAPPPKETIVPFIQIAQRLHEGNICAPEILEASPEHGFMLLSDFGDKLLLDELNPTSVATLYPLAFSTLAKLQSCPTDNIPHFNEPLLRAELDLFTTWYLGEHLKLSLSPQDHALIHRTFDALVNEALSQPRVFVHRDFHSRNLLCTPNQQLGVLDFQDAVAGPITYDLVSLLRDCYITWPQTQVDEWVALFYKQYCHHLNIPFKQYQRWFDWMGLQRHIKVLGIFCRLNYRDHKPRYLDDLPRVLHYVLTVSDRYESLHEFNRWVKKLFG